MKKLLLFIFTSMFGGEVLAQTTFEIGNLKYTVTDEENHYVSVRRGSSYMTGILVIPESIENENIYTITSIIDNAFSYCTGLTSVTIPKTVTTIGDGAFGYCTSLTSVVIPESVTFIGRGAFGGCKNLTSVTLPESVSEISSNMFCICTSLTSVSIPESVTTIGDYAFSGCSGLTSVTIPESATTIGDYAFSGCSGLTSVTIPEYTTIGYNAFSYCSSLTSVTIPKSATVISSYAFENCSCTLYCEAPNSSYNFLGFSGIIYWSISQPKFTNDFIFSIISNEEPYEIEIYKYTGDSIVAKVPTTVEFDGKEYAVTRVRNGAFSGYNNLDYTAYGNAFYIGNEENPYLILMEAKNTKIESCEINRRCRFIYGEAFNGCSKLSEISIPDSVINIGSDAFSGCSSLTRASYASVEQICGIKFENSASNPLSLTHHLYIDTTEVTNLVIPDSVKSIGDYAFYDCNYLTSVTIGDSIENIGAYAFYHCSLAGGVGFDYVNGIKQISIPNSVKKIGNSAFAECYDLQNVDFSSIESLCGIEFGDENANPLSRTGQLYISGEKIVNLVIPETVKSIGCFAFYNCTSIASLTISDSAKSIGSQAFYGCTRLASVEIPNSVIEIGDKAFYGCNYLKSLSYNSNAIGAHFNNIRTLESIFIGDSVKNISGTEFNGCDNLVNVISLATIPPALNGDPYTFADTIWVPAASVDVYKGTTVWKRKEIMPIEYYTVLVAKTDTARGSVIGGGNFVAKQAITIYATPAENYHFKAWSDGNTENPRTIMLDTDVNLTAIFEGNGCTITVNNDITGTITGWENSHYGDTITLTATPTNGYHFVKWSDGTTTNPRTMIVTGDSTINALFEINTYTISASAENGTVSGADIYNFGESVTLTATANEGFHFVKWSDGNTENPRTITVNGDFELTAVFETNENPGTAVAENTAIALNIYAHGRTIVVENATEEIRVYNAMGALVGRDAARNVSTITVNGTGVYIVKTGGVVKRVVVN